jgi:hypothetical protein
MMLSIDHPAAGHRSGGQVGAAIEQAMTRITG